MWKFKPKENDGQKMNLRVLALMVPRTQKKLLSLSGPQFTKQEGWEWVSPEDAFLVDFWWFSEIPGDAAPMSR